MPADDTLIVFTADHSFDLRVVGGKKGESILEGKAVNVDGHHAGEEVVVAAQGPGSERVHGYMPNTQIFHIMMQAYGWEAAGNSGK
jgi:alkaline phosphatase